MQIIFDRLKAIGMDCRLGEGGVELNLGSIAACMLSSLSHNYFKSCTLSRHTVQPQLVLHFIKQTNCHDSNAQCIASASSQMDCFLNCQLFTQVISANVPQQEIQPLNLCNCDLCLFIIHGACANKSFGMQKRLWFHLEETSNSCEGLWLSATTETCISIASFAQLE